MATNRGTILYGYTGTASTTADLVNFTGGRYPSSVAVKNTGSADIFIKTDTMGTADPVANADNTYLVGAGNSIVLNQQNPVSWVKVISASTPTYRVEGYF